MKEFRFRGPIEAMCIEPSDTVDNAYNVTTSKEFTVPAGAEIVIISANGDFWFRSDPTSATAAVPTADVTNGSGSELNPLVRKVTAGEKIAVAAAAAVNVSFSYYKLIPGY